MVWTKVAETSDIPKGSMKHIEAGGTELCIVNAGGTFYALLDRCPHMNASLSMGILEGTVVSCPLHRAQFDIKTGRRIAGPVQPQVDGLRVIPPDVTEYLLRIAAIIAPIRTGNLRVFPVKVERDSVLVDF